MPDYDLYHDDLRPLLDAIGAAALNNLSVSALGYPALLVSLPYEAAAVLVRAAKESEQ